MRRREALAGAAALAAIPIAGRGQPQPMPLIGYFSSRSPVAEGPVQAAFLKGLAQAGFSPGGNVAIEYRFAEGSPDRLPALADDLIRRHPAVLVATDPRAAQAAKSATDTIPIVFTSGKDPVQLGLVASLSRPGGNATGVSLFTTQLGPKRLALLREILPQPGPIAVVLDPTTGTTQFQRRELETAAEALGQALLFLPAGSEAEIERAFAAIAAQRAAALLYGASTYYQVIAEKLVALAAAQRLPALYEWREFVTAGGLMSYSTNRTEVGLQLADYVARILRGAKPAALPVVQSARFELVINLKTAKALDLTMPQSLLARADEVIE